MPEVQNESYPFEEEEFAVTTRKKERERSIDKDNEEIVWCSQFNFYIEKKRFEK
jgi:hypothetical protein